MNKSLVYIFSSFLFFNNLSAQVNIDKLEDLWKIAIQNNPNQKVYNLKREQLGYDYKTSQSFYYPQASASFNGQDNLIQSVTPVPGIIFNKPGTVYLQFGKHYTYNTGLTLNKIWLDRQAELLSKVAKENIQLNNVQQDAYVQTLKTQIGQYYYTSLIAKASLAIAKKDLELADSIYKAVNGKFIQGLTDASAVNQALINENNIKLSVFQSQQLYNQAIANSKILAGVNKDTDLILNESTLENYQNESVSLGIDKTLVPYQNAIIIAELQRKAQNAAFLPKLTSTAYLGFQEYRDRFEMSFSKNAWTDYQYIGIGLNWNLFSGFSNSNKLKSLNTQKRIADENYKAARDQSAIADSLLLDNYNTYVNMVTTSKSNFDLYGKNMNLSLQKFREGLISIDSYFKTFQDYLTAENTYLNNLSNLLTTKASIEVRK